MTRIAIVYIRMRSMAVRNGALDKQVDLIFNEHYVFIVSVIWVIEIRSPASGILSTSQLPVPKSRPTTGLPVLGWMPPGSRYDLGVHSYFLGYIEMLRVRIWAFSTFSTFSTSSTFPTISAFSTFSTFYVPKFWQTESVSSNQLDSLQCLMIMAPN